MPFLGLKTGRRSVVPFFLRQIRPRSALQGASAGRSRSASGSASVRRSAAGGGEQAAGKGPFCGGASVFRCRLGGRSGTCLYPRRPSGPKPVQPVRKRSAGPCRTHRPKLLRIRRILFGRRVNPGIGLFRPRAFRRRLPRAASDKRADGQRLPPPARGLPSQRGRPQTN